MKNSPHRRKHLQHKAIRAASHIQLHPSKRAKKLSTMATYNLRPLNIKKSIDILNLYKKHLERISFIRIHHGDKWSHPGEVTGGPFNFHEKNPNKITNHRQSSDMERSKNIARKMLKQNYRSHKKAA